MKNLNDTNILKMSDLMRYNGRYKIKNESIAEHSFYVGYNVLNICHKYNIPDEIKLKALEFAVIHDIPELYTNDICYITKRDNPKLAAILDEVERDFVENEMPEIRDAFFELQNSKNSIEHTILKLADGLSVLQFASREIALGNQSEEMLGIKNESKQRVEQLENILRNIVKEDK